MRKVVYVGAIFWLGLAFSIQSCEKENIVPNGTPTSNNDSILNPNDTLGNGGNGSDTTNWNDPNGGNNGGNGTDTTNTNPGGNNGGGNNGGGNGTDTTSTNPGGNNGTDSTGIGGN
jgi:hypothetical protein